MTDAARAQRDQNLAWSRLPKCDVVSYLQWLVHLRENCAAHPRHASSQDVIQGMAVT